MGLTNEQVKRKIEVDYGNSNNNKFTWVGIIFKNTKTKLEVEDKDNYKYFLSVENINASMKCNCEPRKFYKNNPYTIYNIKQYITNNNLTCKLITNKYIDNNKQKFEFECKCNKPFYTTLSEFLFGDKHQCNECGRKRTAEYNKFSYEEVNNYVENNNCKLKSTEYVNELQILNYECSCGIGFSNSFVGFKQLKYKCCDECRKQVTNNKPERYNILKKYINGENGNGCSLLTLIDDFEDDRTHINVQCKCGTPYMLQAFAFKAGQKQCPDCGLLISANKRRITDKRITEVINNINISSDTSYIWINGEHINSKSKLDLMDEKGYKYSTSYGNLISIKENGKLMMFHTKNPYTIENIKLWSKANAIGYELLSIKYIDAKRKLLWRCPKGHEFKLNFDNMQHGQRCGQCDISIGEERVLNWILYNKLYYTHQHKDKNCKGKKSSLKFDFAIYRDIEKKHLMCLIEYDGEMHYEVCRFSKNELKQILKFKQQQEYDNIKNEFCIRNNIPLLRIPYWEKNNIQLILDKYIIQFNLDQVS